MTQPEELRLADEFSFCIQQDCIPSIIDIEKAIFQLRRLHAENKALRADAERYRWLARKVSAHGICDGWQFGFPSALTLPANALAMSDPEKALGQCIDAARKEGK